MATEKQINRFWSKVLQSDTESCWPFLGCQDSLGYGRISFDGIMGQRAHIVSYSLTFGNPINCVLHRCDNRICCNPYHLYDGTKKDNVRDRVERGRNGSHKIRGEANVRARLTQSKALEIYNLKNHLSYKEVSARFNVSSSTVYAIWKKERWIT